jgi:hypothetical protein
MGGICPRQKGRAVTTLAHIPRLRQLLLMLSSDQPGEVAAAAAAIGRVLKAAGADWHALANGLLTEALQPKARRWRENYDTEDAADNWRELHEYCEGRTELLRSREQEFIESLGEWHGRPTKKQLAWLCAIYARLRRTT